MADKHEPCRDPFCMDCRCAALEVENARLKEAHQNNVDRYDTWKRERRVLAAPAYYMAEEARAALEHADGA